MEIKRVILKNIGPFETLDIPLAPTEKNPINVTVFIGSNGTGKTSVLQAIARSLSWFTARLGTEKGSGNPITEDGIFNTANAATIEINIEDSPSPSISNQTEISVGIASPVENRFQWTLAKTRKGRKTQSTSQFNDCTRLAEQPSSDAESRPRQSPHRRWHRLDR